jgi:hypothetical protein
MPWHRGFVRRGPELEPPVFVTHVAKLSSSTTRSETSRPISIDSQA